MLWINLCWCQWGPAWEEGTLLVVMCLHFFIQKETKCIGLIQWTRRGQQSLLTVNVIYNCFCSPFSFPFSLSQVVFFDNTFLPQCYTGWLDLLSYQILFTFLEYADLLFLLVVQSSVFSCFVWYEIDICLAIPSSVNSFQILWCKLLTLVDLKLLF